jgi:hypothetical protein
MCLLLLGEPHKALARLALRRAPICVRRPSAGCGLARLRSATSKSPGATFVIMREAATGKVSRQCSDSLLLLAQLAHVEGDDATAIDLLSKLGICRLAPAIHYARVLAATLGVAEQRARDEQECIAPQHLAERGPLGLRRVMTTLRAELTRRGWG